MIGKRSMLIAIALAALTGAIEGQNRSADWPQWRGPNRDGAAASFVELETGRTSLAGGAAGNFEKKLNAAFRSASLGPRENTSQ